MKDSRKTVTIDNKKIGDGFEVKFTAELGVNHLGDFDRAKNMIKSAKGSDKIPKNP